MAEWRFVLVLKYKDENVLGSVGIASDADWVHMLP